MANNSGSIRFKRGFDIPTMAAKLEAFEEILQSRYEAAMNDAVWKVAADAARQAPVDTGALRASIAAEVDKQSTKVIGRIGSNLEYAPIQEIQQPYLRPAIEQNIDWIVNRFEQAVDEAVAAVS